MLCLWSKPNPRRHFFIWILQVTFALGSINWGPFETPYSIFWGSFLAYWNLWVPVEEWIWWEYTAAPTGEAAVHRGGTTSFKTISFHFPLKFGIMILYTCLWKCFSTVERDANLCLCLWLCLCLCLCLCCCLCLCFVYITLRHDSHLSGMMLVRALSRSRDMTTTQ